MSPRIWFFFLFIAVYPAVRIVSALFFFWHFSAIDLDSSNRMPNVRKLPEEVHLAALTSFLKRAKEHHEHSGKKDAILVAGDSQLYGYFLSASETVATHLQRELPSASVYNASRIGASYSYEWARRALDTAISEGLNPRVLIVNANPAAQSTGLAKREQLASWDLFVSLLLANETSEKYATISRDRLLKRGLPFDLFEMKSAPPGDGTYQVAKLERNYYSRTVSPKVESEFRKLLADARDKVELVVVVISPHFYAPYNEPPYLYQWDTSIQVKKYKEICSSYPHAICLDLPSAFGREYFHDIVHLNKSGHQELAKRISRELQPRLIDSSRSAEEAASSDRRQQRYWPEPAAQESFPRYDSSDKRS